MRIRSGNIAQTALPIAISPSIDPHSSAFGRVEGDSGRKGPSRLESGDNWAAFWAEWAKLTRRFGSTPPSRNGVPMRVGFTNSVAVRVCRPARSWRQMPAKRAPHLREHPNPTYARCEPGLRAGGQHSDLSEAQRWSGAAARSFAPRRRPSGKLPKVGSSQSVRPRQSPHEDHVPKRTGRWRAALQAHRTIDRLPPASGPGRARQDQAAAVRVSAG